MFRNLKYQKPMQMFLGIQFQSLGEKLKFQTFVMIFVMIIFVMTSDLRDESRKMQKFTHMQIVKRNGI